MSNTTQNPRIDIEMENGKHMIAELYPDIAPQTVENFLRLVNDGFYDGLVFHRVIEGFMIQGGDPLGNGTGGPGWQIKGEFAQNGHPNPIKHEKGVLSMARSGDPDSAGSQFFLMTSDSPHLDGAYAAFGKLVDEPSLQVATEIVQTPTPRSELAQGKAASDITDQDGKPIAVHQGNLDTPLCAQRIRHVSVLTQ